MRRIIEKGTRQTTTCEECGCYFSFEDEDIEEQNYVEGIYCTPSERKNFKKIVRCPQCENVIILEATR